MKRKLVTIISVFLITMLVTACSNGATNGEDGRTDVLEEDKIVYVTQTSPPNMLNQLEAKELAGFIAWEPFNSDAISQGFGQYLFSSQETWADHPCCILAASEGLTDEKVLTAITWAHIKATQFINEQGNRERVLEYAVDFTGRSKQVVEEALKGIAFVEYPKEQEFKKYYENIAEGNLLNRDITDIGYNTEEDFFNSFFKASIYETVIDELSTNPNWKPEKLSKEDNIRIGYITNDLHQLAIHIAQEEGYYQEVGILPSDNFDINQYSNGVDIMTAFNAKEIDLAYLGGAPAIMKRINDDIQINVIAGANQEGSGLVVLPEIQTLSDLAGQTVAVPGIGTVQYTLLEQELHKNGLTIQLK